MTPAWVARRRTELDALAQPIADLERLVRLAYRWARERVYPRPMSTVAGDLEPIYPPVKPGSHTVEECDAVLARKPPGSVADAWLDERLLAMRDVRDAARAAERHQ